MKGKPKPGETWVCRQDGNSEYWWRYFIVAVGGNIAAVKDNGDGTFYATEFGLDGVMAWAEDFRLTRRSKFDATPYRQLKRALYLRYVREIEG